MRISCGFPPSRDIVDHARRAEALGYDRLWTYDSPALYGDVWIALARVAEATQRIGLGTAVLVPNLRHVLVTASAIASIEELAPGRLACAFGTGFTARRALGKKPVSWKFMRDYLTQLRALLRGETTEAEGARIAMLHLEGFAPKRPIETPLLLGVMGPKGVGIARDIADGVVSPVPISGFDWSALLVNGTVLEPGEDHTSERVREAVGPWFTVSYHGAWEISPAALSGMAGGAGWLARIEALRPDPLERHLAVHEGHCCGLTDRDRGILDAVGPALLQWGWTGTREQVRTKLDAMARAGVTEVIYTPVGPDIPRELDRFAQAVSL
jgi:5,10-methylenetetrahydromethanopterin reductase